MNTDNVQFSKEELSRYNRHIIIKEFGLDGQKKLRLPGSWLLDPADWVVLCYYILLLQVLALLALLISMW